MVLIVGAVVILREGPVATEAQLALRRNVAHVVPLRAYHLAAVVFLLLTFPRAAAAPNEDDEGHHNHVAAAGDDEASPPRKLAATLLQNPPAIYVLVTFLPQKE